MEFGQLMKNNKGNIFTEKLCKKWGRKTSFILRFQENLYMRWKEVARAWFQYFLIALNLAYNKNKLYKTVDYWLKDILNFDFFRKWSGNSFSTIFYVWFSNNVWCNAITNANQNATTVGVTHVCRLRCSHWNKIGFC